MTGIAGRTARTLVAIWCIACLVANALLAVAPQSAFADDKGTPVVVSLGDSYSSGEGTDPFYGQNDADKHQSKDWLAHRSTKAWPGLLKVGGVTLNTIKDNGWYFAAASGAVTGNILDANGTQEKKWADVTGEGTDYLPNQVLAFSMNHVQDKVDYVTLTMGGNDLDFTGIVTTAALQVPTNWNQLPDTVKNAINEAWRDKTFLKSSAMEAVVEDAIEKFRDETRARLVDTYEKVQVAAGSQAKIIIAGYPHLAPENGGGIFNDREAELINTAVDVFDTAMKLSVEQDGNPNTTFVDVRDEFYGHAAYDSDSYINGVMLGAMREDLDQSNPVSAYSMHPNDKGQQAYARAVQAKIDEIESKGSNSQADASTGFIPLPGSVDVAMSLVYDTSGSMDSSSALSGMTRLESAQKQSRDFVNSITSQMADGSLTAQLGVAQFATNASTTCTLTSDMASVLQGIASLDADGTTNMYAGLRQGMDQLHAASGQKLMVFLSDGLNNEGHTDMEVLELARQAANEGIKIYTIGFGPSSTIDEDMLEEIASLTGGKYAHEDSSSLSAAAVGLYATMMDAQLDNTQQLLLSQTGSVQQGQVAQVGTFDVNQDGTMQVILYWPGSVLDMQLTDPEGTLVGAGYAGYDVDTSAIPTRIKITGAKQGIWNMAVYGKQTSMAEEPFYAAAALGNVQEPQQASATSAAPTVARGSVVNNNGETILFLLIAVLVVCLGGVFAFTRRSGNGE